MDVICAGLALIFLVLLVAGLVHPEWVVHWGAVPTRRIEALVYGFAFVVCAALAVYESGLRGSTDVVHPPRALVGDWGGDTAPLGEVASGRTLPLSLNIFADGHVEGRVGDATVVRGGVWRATLTSSWTGGATHYVDLHLRGPLDGDDGLSAENVVIGVRPEDSRLAGTLRCVARLGAGGLRRRIAVSAGLTRG